MDNGSAETNVVQQEKPSLASMIKQKEAELLEVKKQMKRIEEEKLRLSKMNDKLLTRGIELQGAIEALKEVSTLDGHKAAVIEGQNT